MYVPCIKKACLRRASFELSFLAHRRTEEVLRSLMDLLGLFGQSHSLLMAHKIKVAKPLVLAYVKEQGGLLLISIEKLGQADPCQIDDGKAIWKWFGIEL